MARLVLLEDLCLVWQDRPVEVCNQLIRHDATHRQALRIHLTVRLRKQSILVDGHARNAAFADGTTNAFVHGFLEYLVVLQANACIMIPHVAEVTTNHM